MLPATHPKRSIRGAHCPRHVEIKQRLIAGRNQNVMRLVLIELTTAGGIELEASPLRSTVDCSERNSPLQQIPNSSIILRDFMELACCPFFISVAKLSAQAVTVCVILAILFCACGTTEYE
jgi:hypothetical protein